MKVAKKINSFFESIQSTFSKPTTTTTSKTENPFGKEDSFKAKPKTTIKESPFSAPLIKKNNTPSVIEKRQVFKPILNGVALSSALEYSGRKLNSTSIKNFQTKLGLEVTGVADEKFVQNVAKFQKANNLTVDGKIGTKTKVKLSTIKTKVDLNKIDNPLNDKQTASALDYSGRKLNGAIIEKLQSKLGLEVTGIADEKFVQNVAKFQKANNLTVDGKTGVKTNNQIFSKTSIKTYPKYDKMFADGVLDTTFGIGFDENDNHKTAERNFVRSLTSKGFKEIRSQKELEKIFKAHDLELPAENKFVKYYYKPNITTYKGKPVAGITKLVLPNGDDGSKSKAAFVDGMKNSDLAIYLGHGRYGTGPDFDRNFTTNVNFKNGKSENYEDYKFLKERLKDDNFLGTIVGKDNIKEYKGLNDIQRFNKLMKSNLVDLQGVNGGNLRVNEKSPHRHEFGGFLMESALKDKRSPVANLTEIASENENNYKVWAFIGCRTDDYLHNIQSAGRSDQSLNSKNLDIFSTNDLLYWRDVDDNAINIMEGIINKGSAQDIKNGIESIRPEDQKGKITLSNFGENPKL